MVDVDERVVQMKFDSSDFETKTKSTFKILDTLKEKLSFKDTADDSSSLMSIADNVQKVADKAYTIVDRTIDKIKDNIANKLVSYLRVNTIGQIEAGWSKYADMTTSVATLKAQGYEMRTINEQLERLMYFTDETSFKFTDMVGEIGKFTAAGQKLEDATQAMMGIALWASLSGKNANEASRAMYQLSQALGAGQMRLQDYKSIQNLNMDTKEFRQNAIDAAVAVGTLRDNLNGTWTSTKNEKVIVDLQNFAESLTKGQWFTTDVMMAVYEQYSEAVDEIHEKYLELGETVPTAQLIKEAKEANEEALAEFKNVNLDTKDVDKILKRWKNILKVTDKTVADYAKINEITEDTARKELTEQYNKYLQEYAEIFQGTEEDAEEALEKFKKYTSQFGIKAFMSGQEAKTFTEAVESAMDAASTVWLHIYQDIFGDYEEATELWTALANNLYDIFVGRLWSIAEIFDYWKTGFEDEVLEELEEKSKEYEELKKAITEKPRRTQFIDDEGVKEDERRLKELKAEIEEIQAKMDLGLYNGRRVMMQGLEAFGAGFKSISTSFRQAWDNMFGENESGKKLFAFSERFRELGFRFYLMMQQFLPDEETGEFANQFFPNIAKSIMNILSPLKAAIDIAKAVIGQFLPNGKTFAETLESISERIKNITEYLVPSQETISKIARIVRGIVATIKLGIKIIIGFYNAILKPIISTIFGTGKGIIDIILDLLANIGDLMFKFEEGLTTAEAFEMVWEKIKVVLEAVLEFVKFIVQAISKLLKPIIEFVGSIVVSIYNKIKSIFGGNGNPIDNIADSFKKLRKRAKEAWNSSESFASIFMRFREGKGPANFIEMLGEMLMTFIEKVGKTIGAIFNLEEAFDNSKLGAAGEKVKTFLLTTVEIIKWIWTNVLRPMVETFFKSVATLLRTMGEQLRNGDIKGLLQTLREIIQTFTSMQLFKMFRVITQVFGSGGLIRLMRKASKALNGLWMLEGAMAMDYISKALVRLAAGIVLVAAAMAALSYLPEENLQKVNSMMIAFTISFAIFAGILVAITALADKASWGFLGMGFAFGSLAVVMFVFIWAAEKLDKKLKEICSTVDETTGEVKDPELIDYIHNLGGTLLSFLTIMGVVLSIFAVMRKVTAGSSTITFTLGFIGLITAVSSITNAIQTLLNVFHDPKNSIDEVILAIGLLMGMFITLSVATRIMSKLFVDNGTKFKEGLGQGIGYAITMATMALVIRMVIIPTLDTLVENKDKFPEYVDAMIIIALAMISIGATLGLMTRSTKFLAILAAAVAFRWIANMLQDLLIPALVSLKEIKFTDVIGGIGALDFLMLGIASAVFIISRGISSILNAMMTIDWRAMLSLSIVVGIMIIAIMTLTSILNNFGEKFDPTPIWMIVGVIGAIFAIIAIFGLISNGLLSVKSKMKAVASMILALSAMIAAIGLATAGLLYIISDSFYRDEDWAIGIMITFFIGIAGILLSMATAFAIMSSSLKKAFFATLNKEELALFTGTIATTLLFVSIMIAEVVGAIAVIGTVYKNSSVGDKLANVLIDAIIGLLLPIVVLLASSVAFITFIGALVNKFMKVPGLITEIKIVSIMLVSLIAGLLFMVTACLTVLSFNRIGNNIVNAILLLVLTIVPILTLLFGVATFVTKLNVQMFNRSIPRLLLYTLGGFVLSLLAMIPLMKVLGEIELLNYTNVFNALLLLIGTIGSVFVGVGLLLAASQKMLITINQVKVIGVALAGIAALLLAVGLTLIPAMKNLENADPNAIFAIFYGLTILIGGAIGLIAALSALNKIAWKNMLTGVLVFFSVFFTIAIFGPAVIDIFRQFNEISLWDIVKAIIAFIAPFALITYLIGAFSAVSGGFLLASGAIALGFAIMAGGIYLFTSALGGLFDLLGINLRSNIAEQATAIGTEAANNISSSYSSTLQKGSKQVEDATKEGLVDPTNNTYKKEEKMKSPSKVFQQYGKFIDQGLVKGIKDNYELVENVSEGLGIVTDEGFTDTLEIASPSKVFYENGRFVIRGLMDGMNSYKGKAYDTGATVGEGIGDSLSEALDTNIKDKFLGIWTSGDMDAEIKKAGESFTNAFSNGIFGDGEDYTEEELAKIEAAEKRIAEIEKRKKDPKYKWNQDDESELAAAKANLEDLKNKSKTTLSDFGSSLSSLFGDAFTDATEGEGGISQKITGWLGSVKDNILGFVGGDDSDSLKTELNNTLNGEGGVVSETVNNAGEKIETGLAGVLQNLTGSTDLEDGAHTLGTKIGDSIWSGISERFFGRGGLIDIGEALDFYFGSGSIDANKATFLNWRLTKGMEYGLDQDNKYRELMNIFLNQHEGIEYSLEYFDSIAQQYVNLAGATKYLKRIDLNDAGRVIFDVDWSSYLKDLSDDPGTSSIGQEFLPKMVDAIENFVAAGGNLEDIHFDQAKILEYFDAYKKAREEGNIIDTITLHNVATEFGIGSQQDKNFIRTFFAFSGANGIVEDALTNYIFDNIYDTGEITFTKAKETVATKFAKEMNDEYGLVLTEEEAAKIILESHNQGYGALVEILNKTRNGYFGDIYTEEYLTSEDDTYFRLDPNNAFRVKEIAQKFIAERKERERATQVLLQNLDIMLDTESELYKSQSGRYGAIKDIYDRENIKRIIDHLDILTDPKSEVYKSQSGREQAIKEAGERNAIQRLLNDLDRNTNKNTTLYKEQSAKDRAIRRAMESSQDRENTRIVKEYAENSGKYLLEQLGYDTENLELTQEQAEDLRDQLITLGLMDKTTGHIKNSVDDYKTWSQTDADNRTTFFSNVTSMFTELLSLTRENKPTTTTQSRPGNAETYNLARYLINKAGSKSALDDLYEKASHNDKEAAKELERILGGKSYKKLLEEIENEYYKLDYKKKLGHTALTSEEKDKLDFYSIYYGMDDNKSRTYAINQVGSYIQKMANASKDDIKYGNTKLWADEIAAYREAYNISDQEIQGLIDGLSKNESKFLKKQADLAIAGYTIFKAIYGIESPSKLFYGYGEYIVEGFDNGIIDSMTENENTIKDWTDLMTDNTKAGLSAMSDMLKEDVNPKITPVFDDTSISTGMYDINRAIDMNSPKLEATLNSFNREAPNYDSKFEDLELAIGNTNTLLGSLMELLETGDVTTVNVEVQPSPDNIYDSVIRTNRQRFNRTGRNGFNI